MASWYERNILPKFLACACSGPQMMRQRSRLVPRAEGRVLELGVGMGLNLAFYDPARVTSVSGVDPAAELRALAEAAPFLRDGEMLAVFAARFDAALTEARMREARIAAPAPLRVDPAVAVLPGWRA